MIEILRGIYIFLLKFLCYPTELVFVVIGERVYWRRPSSCHRRRTICCVGLLLFLNETKEILPLIKPSTYVTHYNMLLKLDQVLKSADGQVTFTLNFKFSDCTTLRRVIFNPIEHHFKIIIM